MVLNRNFFKEPANYDVNLTQLTSSLRIRFLSNTRWLEDCLRQGRRLDLRNEILPPTSGGVIILGAPSQSGNSQIGAASQSGSKGVDPHVVSQLAALLRAEKKATGAKWKVMAPLATLTACGGMLEGLEGVAAEVLKSGAKKGGLDFMLDVRECHVAGYRHVIAVLNKERYQEDGGGGEVEKVVCVVDASGLAAFAQTLQTQRKEQTQTFDNEKKENVDRRKNGDR